MTADDPYYVCTEGSQMWRLPADIHFILCPWVFTPHSRYRTPHYLLSDLISASCGS
jgi:hypothetical protein